MVLAHFYRICQSADHKTDETPSVVYTLEMFNVWAVAQT